MTGSRIALFGLSIDIFARMQLCTCVPAIIPSKIAIFSSTVLLRRALALPVTLSSLISHGLLFSIICVGVAFFDHSDTVLVQGLEVATRITHPVWFDAQGI